MTNNNIPPLISLNRRADELVSQLLGLNEREKQLFESIGEPMRQFIVESKKENNDAR